MDNNRLTQQKDLLKTVLEVSSILKQQRPDLDIIIRQLAEVDEDSSCMEQAFSIFMNNIELDNEGNVLNYKYCERRAAEWGGHK